MTETSTLTVRLTTETKAKLDRLANQTHRTRDDLVDKALADHLDRELEIVEAVERGRAEIRAGHGLSSDEVFAAVEDSIVTVEVRQDRR